MADTTIPADIKKLSFEEALDQLKAIVQSLESGESKLQDAISAYERGAALKKHCESKLRDAAAKIEKITLGEGGSVATEPLDVD